MSITTMPVMYEVHVDFEFPEICDPKLIEEEVKRICPWDILYFHGNPACGPYVEYDTDSKEAAKKVNEDMENFAKSLRAIEAMTNSGNSLAAKIKAKEMGILHWLQDPDEE